MTKAQLSRIALGEGLHRPVCSAAVSTRSPSRGGALESAHFEVCAPSDYFAALGKIRAQVNPLPGGARITSVRLV